MSHMYTLLALWCLFSLALHRQYLVCCLLHFVFSDSNTCSAIVSPEDGTAIRQDGERREEDAPDRGGPAEYGRGRNGDVKHWMRSERAERVICGR